MAGSDSCLPDTFSKQISVNQQCEIDAIFEASPESGDAPLTVQFTDLSVGNPTWWYWDFGDGSVAPLAEGESPEVACSSGRCGDNGIKNPKHVYTEPGVYTVTLMAGSDSCLPDTFSKQITVNQQCVVTAQFDATPMKGTAPLTVQFTDRSIGNPTRWHWNFGDSGIIPMSDEEIDSEVECSGSGCNPDRIANPIHTYTEPGIYTVTLRAGSDSCLPGTASQVIEVTGPEYDGEIPLSGGWNFVSVPAKLAPGKDDANIFSVVDSGGHSMFMYDTAQRLWINLDKNTPIRPLEGYWIYSVGSVNVPLFFDTNPVQTPPSKLVKKGWNAIGQVGISPLETKYVLLSLGDSWVNCVGFDASIQQYEQTIIRGSNDNIQMRPYKGYWLYTGADGTLAGTSA